jgi:hypothetical protein
MKIFDEYANILKGMYKVRKHKEGEKKERE